MSRRTAFGATVALALLAMVATAMPATGAVRDATQSGKLVIWADKDRKPAVEQVANTWARSRGVNVEVVQKEFGDIDDDLATVRAENAPDVIVGAHDWTGKLAANGLILPLFPSAATRRSFPTYSLDAFSYGTAVKRLYGAPVALENIGLVVNTRLAAVPRSFADLQRRALAFKNRASGNIAIAVPQGANGDAYHMYPFFSGLGGYVFARTRAGTLNPRRVGVANPVFLRNAAMIDTWNRTGLINSKLDYGTAKDAFMKGKAAYWITGPWESDALKGSGLRFRIVQLPRIKFRSAPFLGVQGYMVTRFSTQHGVESLAKNLVSSYMMTANAQQTLAAANGRFPANRVAGRRVTDPVLRQFGAASTGGVPMPNIPQMDAVWTELGGAWVKSTRGSGATRARVAFQTAARNIRNKIG